MNPRITENYLVVKGLEKMLENYPDEALRPNRFFDTPPAFYARRFAQEHNCDLAIPNESGIGNILCYTRLVEEMGMAFGRPLDILTAPFRPGLGGLVPDEPDYPLFLGSPFVRKITNADSIDPSIMVAINVEQDNYCQFNHVIENLCGVYGLSPRALRPSLFLSRREMAWGLKQLSGLPRPVICIHPGGTSSSLPGSPWFLDNWRLLVEHFRGRSGIWQIGKHGFDIKDLPIPTPDVSIRKKMALVWASDLFVGFDSGPAHMATAFEKPAVVLWDAARKAPLEERKEVGFSTAHLLRWSYPQNRNLLILGEKGTEVLYHCVEFVEHVIRLINGKKQPLTLPFDD